MTTRPGRLLAAALLGLGALALPAAAGTASASGTAAARTAATAPVQTVVRDRAARPVGVVRSAAVTAAAQRAVRAYWTPARMRAARPAGDLLDRGRRSTAPPVDSGRAGRGTAPDDAVGRVSPGRAGVVLGVPWRVGAAKVVRTTGKVFFRMGGYDYVCSGSAVTTADESTVLTAGHCVADAGVYATNWTFVPGYDDGAAPYGTFVATHLATSAAWLNGDPEATSTWEGDYAFANVGRNGASTTLHDAVGSQPVGFSTDRGQKGAALGYPAEDPYDGQTLQWCAGPLGTDTVGGTSDHALRCGMTGGSSGGPWFVGLDRTAGTGTIVSVTSFGYVGYEGTLYGPYLGATASTLFDAVKGTTSA